MKLHDQIFDVREQDAVQRPSIVSDDDSAAAIASAIERASSQIPVSDGRLDLEEVLAAVNETAYAWNFLTDGLVWHPNARAVMGLSGDTDIATGRNFRDLIAAAHRSRHEETIRHAQAAERGSHGTPYKICYRLGNHDETCQDSTIWVEDRGRCWLGEDGRPERATGVIRRLETGTGVADASTSQNSMDVFTGLPNAHGFKTALNAHLSLALSTERHGALLVIEVAVSDRDAEQTDLDDEEALVLAFAKKLKQVMRRGDIIGRIASRRFGVILVDCAASAIGPTCDRVMDQLKDVSVKTASGTLNGQFNIGAVEMQSEAANDLMDRANEALVEACRVPGTSYYVGTSTHQHVKRARQNKLSIAAQILDALEHDRMRLVLQPLVSAKTGRAALYECLLRMELPDGTVIPAGEFIEDAERLGLWRLIDRRALELAISLAEQYDDLNLTLNVSSLTTGDDSWLASFKALTATNPQVARRLTVEITETEAIHDVKRAQHFIAELKSAGCRIAIDDFGAGYTSFKNLKLLDIDIVKIDGSFVRNLVTDPADRIFIKTLVDLAESFDIETVAESVVDDRCAQILAETGVTYLQGFHYGQPKPAAEFDYMAGQNDA